MEVVKDGLNEKSSIGKKEGQGDRSETTGIPKKGPTESVKRGGKTLKIR